MFRWSCKYKKFQFKISVEFFKKIELNLFDVGNLTKMMVLLKILLERIDEELRH